MVVGVWDNTWERVWLSGLAQGMADTDQKLKVGCALWLERGAVAERGVAEWAGTRDGRH